MAGAEVEEVEVEAHSSLPSTLHPVSQSPSTLLPPLTSGRYKSQRNFTQVFTRLWNMFSSLFLGNSIYKYLLS